MKEGTAYIPLGLSILCVIAGTLLIVASFGERAPESAHCKCPKCESCKDDCAAALNKVNHEHLELRAEIELLKLGAEPCKCAKPPVVSKPCPTCINCKCKDCQCCEAAK